MASTQIADLKIYTKVFSEYVRLRMLETNRFLTSGVAVTSDEIAQFLGNSMGGKTVSIRYNNPIANDDPNISSDDPTKTSTPRKVGTTEAIAVRQSLNTSLSEMDLAVRLNGADPLMNVGNLLADYWNTIIEKRALMSLQGVYADNVANDSKDMVVDITTGTGAAALFNKDAYVDAVATMGDRGDNLKGMAVHSTVFATMQKSNAIEYVQDKDGTKRFAYYGDTMIFVDDLMTVTGAGTAEDPKKFHTILFGEGALSIGYGFPQYPFEYERKASSGNGGGESIIHSRLEAIIHPNGFSCGLTSTPTGAELIAAANWDRAFERKRCNIAFLISKG